MNTLIQQFKNMFAGLRKQSLSHVKAVHISPRRDWFVLIVTLFGALCLSASLAWYIGFMASHTSTGFTTVGTSLPSLNQHTFDMIKNYFDAKAQMTQTLQNNAGAPSNVSL